jgi:rsbT antagonist protein RsbS
MDGSRIPVIRLAGNFLVSIQVEMTDHMLAQLKEDVANAVDTGRASGLVIDVAGIETMDSFISRSICDLALIARLMGVQTVLCGIRPAVAVTLAEMGIDLRGVPSALDLDDAVALLERTRIDAARTEDEEETEAAGQPVVGE